MSRPLTSGRVHDESNRLLDHILSQGGQTLDTAGELDIMLGGSGVHPCTRFQMARGHLLKCPDPSHMNLCLTYRKPGRAKQYLAVADRDSGHATDPLLVRISSSFRGIRGRVQQWTTEREVIVKQIEAYADEALSKGNVDAYLALRMGANDFAAYGAFTARTKTQMVAAGIPA